ncbi:MAG: AtpZ/AtpI family protein [Thermoleophilia bacterium]
MTPDRPEGNQSGRRRPPTSAETVAFMVLGGIVTGLGIGAGIDWLLDTLPWMSVIGVFAGFALALYAIYLETK